ncbi:hypothetical protein [Deinococcus ficus]|uniref:hypothetical protein n=1 Tax=Deinococcus ficus TaxID=317577 RepID=UPI0012DBE7F6|nr:hypothetical protein [Deinococcus ficus]
MTWHEFETLIAAHSWALELNLAQLSVISAKVTGSAMDVELILEGHDQDDQSICKKWLVHVDTVYEHHLQLLPLDDVPRVVDDHPRIRTFQSEWTRLYFAASPQRPQWLVSELFSSHDDKEFGPFQMYGPYGDPGFGSGVLAEGPASLMEAYAKILDGHGMRPTTLPTVNPLWRRHNGRATRPEQLQLLNLSGDLTWAVDNFVLGRQFSIRLVT